MLLSKLITIGHRRSDLEVEFKLGNIIIGENGRGKSHVVSAIDLLFGEVADDTVIKQGKQPSSVLRYARDPREGFTIIGMFDTSKGPRIITREWRMNAAGEAGEKIVQDFFPEVKGTRDQGQALAGLLPLPSLWDPRDLLNASPTEKRARVMRILALTSPKSAADYCPADAPDWAVPQPKESAVDWVGRMLTYAKGQHDAAAREYKEGEAQESALADAYIPRAAPDRRLLNELDAKLDAMRDRRAKEQLVATLSESLVHRPLAPTEEALQHAREEVEAAATAVWQNATAREKFKTEGRALADERQKLDAKLARKPKPCTKCGHVEGWDVEEEARMRARVDEIKQTVSVYAIQVADLTAALEGLQASTQAKTAELDEMEEAKRGAAAYDALETDHAIAKAELEEMGPAPDEARLLADYEIASAEYEKAIRLHQRHADLAEAKEQRKQAGREKEKWAEWLSKAQAWQTAIMDQARGGFEAAVSSVVGAKMELALHSPKGTPDCRFLFDGIDASSLEDSAQMRLVRGIQIALAPAVTGWKKVSLDRFESISAANRTAFARVLLGAAREKRIDQFFLSGCPDTLDEALRQEKDLAVIAR